MNVSAWILGARIKTLSATVVPILVASALAYASQRGAFHLGLSLFALACTLFIQIGTNLINDALDFKKGADSPERVGPLRMSQAGLASPKTVFFAGMICFMIAAILGVPLVISGGLPILGIGVFSLFFGYLYTGGPFPLAYIGMGDFFVLIFFGWVAVVGLFYLQLGHLSINPWFAGTQTGLMAMSMIAINNFRDALTDRKVGKMTLSARLGERFSKFEISFALLAPFAIGLFWWFRGWRAPFLLPLITLPFAFRICNEVFKLSSELKSPLHNRTLAHASMLGMMFGVLLSMGFLIS